MSWRYYISRHKTLYKIKENRGYLMTPEGWTPTSFTLKSFECKKVFTEISEKEVFLEML